MGAVSTALVAVLLLVEAAGRTTPAARRRPGEASVPEILSPKDDEHVPRKNLDPGCPAEGPCKAVLVKARTSPGTWPFLVVAPLSDAPNMWVQPLAGQVKRDSTFSGFVYLGTNDRGAGQRFNILVLACKDKKKLAEGQVLVELPFDCLASDPVTVVRDR
jgi:hypothetical protein